MWWFLWVILPLTCREGKEGWPRASGWLSGRHPPSRPGGEIYVISEIQIQIHLQIQIHSVEFSPGLGRLLQAQDEHWSHRSRASWSRCSRNNQNHRWLLLWNIIRVIMCLITYSMIIYLWFIILIIFHLIRSVLLIWNPAWFLRISYLPPPTKDLLSPLIHV